MDAILPPNSIEELEKNKALAERQQLTKKERKALKRQQNEKERGKEKSKRKFKKVFNIGLAILILGGGILAGGWFLVTRPTAPESDIIARQGLHWHPELSIKILGQKMEIPANIGLGITERPIHTHDDMGVIHLEFSGLVKKDDVRLGKFFEIWGKKFNKDCIFDKCSGSESKLRMLVNGKENFEFENYVMKDGDKIEIVFE